MITYPVSLPEDVVPRLREIADRRGMTLEDLIREALLTYVLHESFLRAIGDGEARH